MSIKIQHINPEGLNKNPAFTNVIVVNGPTKTVYVGGQNSVDSNGKIIGKADITKQAEQVMKNILIALQSAEAVPENIVKWNVYIVQGHSLQDAVRGFQKVLGYRTNPPTLTVAFVSGLAHPDFLIEVDAIAPL